MVRAKVVRVLDDDDDEGEGVRLTMRLTNFMSIEKLVVTLAGQGLIHVIPPITTCTCC